MTDKKGTGWLGLKGRLFDLTKSNS